MLPMGIKKGCIVFVIPLFKHSVLIVDAIESLLKQQTDHPLAIVIVDDGCPHVQSVVATIGLTIASDRVYCIRHQNRGLSGARNRGIEFALQKIPDCEAIFFLDADNVLLPFAMNSFRCSLDQHPEFDWFYPNIKFFGIEANSSYAGAFSPAIESVMNLCEAGSLVRRRVFEAGIRFDESMKSGYEDWDFWLSAVERGFRGRHLPSSGFYYRKRPESMLADSTRSDREIRSYMDRKHGWMGDPAVTVALEHRDTPRFAIVLVDRSVVRLTSDPMLPGEEISLAEYEKRFWAHVTNPNVHNVGAFVLLTTEPALAWLADCNLLRWAFWDLESRLDHSSFTTLNLRNGLNTSISTGISEAASNASACFVLSTMKMVCGICADASDAWIRSLPVDPRDRQVEERCIDLPLGETARPVTGLMLDEYVHFCLRLRAYSFRQTASSFGTGVTFGSPDRSAVPRLLRERFGGKALPPVAQPSDGRVAFVLPICEFGGVEKVALQAARALKARGYAPSLVMIKGQKIQLLDDLTAVYDEIYFVDRGNFAEFHGLEYHGTFIPKWSVSGDHASVANLLASFEFVINCHAADILGVMGLLRRRGVITASYLHVFDRTPKGHLNGHPVLAVAYEHALDFLVSCSRALSSQLLALGTPSDKIVTVPNAAGFEIDPGLAARIMDRRMKRATEPLRVLFIGRFDYQKGIDHLQTIVRRFRGRPETATFRVVGQAIMNSDAPIDEIRDIAEPPVYSTGGLIELYEWADVVLMPSRYEGLPLTIIEAMSFGAVVIVSDVGAVEEVIENGVNGIIVPQARVVPDAAAAIERFASDRSYLRSLAVRAQETALRRRWDTAIEDLLRLMERAKRSKAVSRTAANWAQPEVAVDTA